MKTKTILTLLILALTACAPALTPAPIVLPPTFTPIGTATFIAPTPYPTLAPLPIFTPDVIQVARWQEYQLELAKVLLADYFLGDSVSSALCEWDILGRSSQEVYVWAVCVPRFGGGSERLPAVIYLEADGAVQKVSVPMHSTSSWNSQIHKMFPEYVIQKFYLYSENPPFGRVQEMFDHIHYRETHPEEPPLIVFGKAPTATPVPPTPTPPVVAVFTPDAIQLERWKEYQTELAKTITCDARQDCHHFEHFVCEWDILEGLGQNVYVWAFCAERLENRNIQIYSNPAVIHLEINGAIRNIEVPFGILWDGTPWENEIRRLFPTDVQEKIFIYHLSKRYDELAIHSADRVDHPETPPLIVLSAMPTTTSMP